MRSRLLVIALLGTIVTVGATSPVTETLNPTTLAVRGAAATIPRGINNSGQIVGTYTCPAGGCHDPDTNQLLNTPGTHGFLYENGAFTPIDVAGPGFDNVTQTFPRAVSPQGAVVGQYNEKHSIVKPDGTTGMVTLTHGFIRSAEDGTYSAVDVPPAYFDHPSSQERNTLAIRISPQGDLVGCFHEDSQTMTTMHGWLWRNGDWTVLATPHAADPSAHDPDTMNNGVAATGQIVGYYFTDGISYIADENGILTTFRYPGEEPTFAWDINARGEIVGVHGAPARGFLRNARGDFRDLVVQGATMTQLFGINDVGDVVGGYTDAVGTHGFVARVSNRANQ